MAYYVNVFSPDTYEAFSKSPRDIAGFRKNRQKAADKIQVGDKLICYMTKLSRWIGVLEVQSECFSDDTSIFVPKDEPDPYVIRFKVKPLAWLPKEKTIPIHDNRVWDHLSFTKNVDKNSSLWTGKIRNSLNELKDNDGHFLEQLILDQVDKQEVFEIDEVEYQKLITHRIHRLEKVVSVTIPQDTESEIESSVNHPEVRESIKIQSLLASIGSQMGMKIWLPRSDRNAVLTEWKNKDQVLLDVLPLNYDETTIKTIEQIDVLWLKGRSIVRAFEVEHTTSIYSGILRMADLLALQPNMNIKLHIVAPPERRDKVFQEIRRPVFSLLDVAPLSERCTYLSYESVQELAREKHLSRLLDSVLDDYAEEAE
ncbi:EVE domain-containing protein [Okeanomitos corallinicola TIOX110]|uniref:EVE domain-containing protein n=1 Tax=Okeanomitos corallinicola TIOX110 TaxID=3133117 RepID=A0ABZ2UUU3_9CYAN